MQYKDLIFKITSQSDVDNSMDNIKKENPDINLAKKSVQPKDVLIGIMSDNLIELTPSMLHYLKIEIERTLTVLFNSPISDTFAFLPYSKNILEVMVDTFPDKTFHFIASEENFNNIKAFSKTKLNIKIVYQSNNINIEFANKIDYLVTINTTLEPTLEAQLKSRNVMIFPMTLTNSKTQSFSQPEKLVKPDTSGWVYNSANGMWIKNWGWDGSQSIPSWQAPSDWNLNPNPDITTGA